jgi:putative transposase
MSKTNRTHTPPFKAQVALAALKGDRTISAVAAHYQLHVNLVTHWKKQLLEGAANVFAPAGKSLPQPDDPKLAELYEQIGRLQVELAFVKKNLPASVEWKRHQIELNHPQLSVRQQCDLLELNRSSFYYEPTEADPEDLQLMERIDRLHTESPFYGSRKLAVELSTPKVPVNRKRVQRLMRLMGLEALYCRPKTTVPNRCHKVYPYLLRDVKLERPNQVWSADITYIPMSSGFMYLAATIDWFSRFVVSWKLSNTLDGLFCQEMLEEALSQGKPDVFNTDQGVQFTANAWTTRLENEGVSVSMDGKGRCMDNIFVERLWRSVKYEYAYPCRPESVLRLEQGLRDYFRFYNQKRIHQSLDYQTPAEVHQTQNRRPLEG